MEDQVPDMVNQLCNDFGFNQVTEFMRLTPPRWLAEVLGEDSPLYASLMSMGHKYTGYYRYEGGDDQVTRFRHIASDRVLEVTNRSLVGLPRNMKDPSLILRTGFVEWNGQWWLSGQISSYEDSEDLIGQITGDDDEYNLFEPEEDLPDDEQQIILTDILATHRGRRGATPRRIGYRLAGSVERRDWRRFLHRPGTGGQIKGLCFYDDPNNLLLDNLRFVTEYVKR